MSGPKRRKNWCRCLKLSDFVTKLYLNLQCADLTWHNRIPHNHFTRVKHELYSCSSELYYTINYASDLAWILLNKVCIGIIKYT